MSWALKASVPSRTPPLRSSSSEPPAQVVPSRAGPPMARPYPAPCGFRMAAVWRPCGGRSDCQRPEARRPRARAREPGAASRDCSDKDFRHAWQDRSWPARGQHRVVVGEEAAFSGPYAGDAGRGPAPGSQAPSADINERLPRHRVAREECRQSSGHGSRVLGVEQVGQAGQAELVLLVSPPDPTSRGRNHRAVRRWAAIAAAAGVR
jgi:hypothetical protein